MTYQYIITGEDFVDRSIPESAFTFPYVLCAESMSQAREMFYTIFPSCNIVTCLVRECNA
jgi:hypothetical protein